jgi:uracil-DNA glycosylase family 4
LRAAPLSDPPAACLTVPSPRPASNRQEIFVTNAVKHFKFESRGKRRLHKTPNAYEIDRCRWWNDLERQIVHPALVIALGATAARSLMGRTVTISKIRGSVLVVDSMRLLVTIHPSYLLRIKDEAAKTREYEHFVSDLKACGHFRSGLS